MPSSEPPRSNALVPAAAAEIQLAGPAQSLAEAGQHLKLEPLPYGSPLYIDLAAARATKEV